MNNTVRVSGGEQRDSAASTHASILPQGPSQAGGRRDSAGLPGQHGRPSVVTVLKPSRSFHTGRCFSEVNQKRSDISHGHGTVGFITFSKTVTFLQLYPKESGQLDVLLPQQEEG